MATGLESPERHHQVRRMMGPEVQTREAEAEKLLTLAVEPMKRQTL